MVVSLLGTSRRTSREQRRVALARLHACMPSPNFPVSQAAEGAPPQGAEDAALPDGDPPLRAAEDALLPDGEDDAPKPEESAPLSSGESAPPQSEEPASDEQADPGCSVEVPAYPYALSGTIPGPQEAGDPGGDTVELPDTAHFPTEGGSLVQRDGHHMRGQPAGTRRVAERLAAKVPISVRGGLIDPGRRAVGALAAVGLAAALVAGVYLWRSRPEPVTLSPRQVATTSAPAEAPAASQPTVSAAGTQPRASPSPAASPTAVVVDVGGKVDEPGVYTLPAGSRVIDAVKAAGGVEDDAKTTRVNLAREVADGEKILVGVPRPAALDTMSGGGAQAAGATDPAAGGVLDLNAATAQQLEELPGIGPVLSERIVDYRTEHGGFGSAGELKEVSGIGEATFADVEDKVKV